MNKISDLAVLLLRFFSEHALPIEKYAILNVLEQLDLSSLGSLQDILSNFNIKSLVVELEFNDLSEVPLPFFAQNRNGDFLLVTAVENSGLNCFVVKRGKLLSLFLDEKKLNEIIGNIFLLAEMTPRSGYSFTNGHLIEQFVSKIDGWFAIIVLAFWLIYSWSILSGTHFILFFINIFGGLVSYLLLRKEFGQKDRLAELVCNVNAQLSCDAVLDSKLSKKLHPFSFAGFAFAFFIGNALLVDLDVYSFIFYVFSTLGGFFTFFTVYYQWRIVKKWCVLCLLITGVILINVVLLYLNFYRLNWDIKDAIIHVFVYLFTFLMYVFIRKKLDFEKQYRIATSQINWFKESKQIFDFVISDSPTFNVSFQPPFVFGSSTPENRMEVILHPNCPACRSLFTELRNILCLNEDMQFSIAIAYDMKNLDAKSKMVVFCRLYKVGEDEALDFLEEWLIGSGVMQGDGNGASIDELLSRNLEFIQAAKPRYFPTVFLNGHHVPKIYSPHDLKILLAK